jgi:transcriptional regulator with XRE-family HTH domain
MEPTDLRTWRITHGLSQRALAEHLGVSYRTVQDWEAGVRNGVRCKIVDLALAELERRLTPPPATETRAPR